MYRVSKFVPGLGVVAGLLAATALTPTAMAQPRPTQAPVAQAPAAQPAPAPAAQAAQPGAQLGNDITVRLAGSSTIGGPLMVELATAWARKLGLPGVRIDAGMDPDEFDVLAERAESSRKLRVQVRAKGSGTGIEQLVRGQADIWMSSRPVQESDIDALRRRNVPNVPNLALFQQPGTENVIGLDALAVVVNSRNPVRALSMAQIRDIYTGRVSNWSQIGGPNLPIALYSPDTAYGTNNQFCGTIVGVEDVQKCLDGYGRLAAPRFNSQEDLADAVAANPGGIGYTSLSLRRSTRPVQLGTECGTGMEPDIFRIKTDEYPLGRRMFMYVYPGRAAAPATREFINFVLGPDGQKAVAQAGFADLAPGRASENYGAERLDTARNAQDGGRLRIRPTDVRAFEEATASADRISITFRFQAGTNNLDSRAEADLTRLGELLKLPAYDKYQVVLVGFSASAGDYGENRVLSRDRAEAVRERLAQQYNVQNAVALGVGPAAAVACNLDPNTASLNQRVEVWLRKAAGG